MAPTRQKKKEKENNKWVQIVIANQFPVSHTRNAIQFSIHFHGTIIVAVDTQLYAPYVIDWVKIMMELNECNVVATIAGQLFHRALFSPFAPPLCVEM